MGKKKQKSINNKNTKKDIKKDLNKINIVIVSIIALILLIIFLPKGRNNIQIKLEIIEYDIKDDSVEVVKKFKLKEKDLVKLDKYDGNDIKIISIDKDGVVISRDATRYEITKQDGPYQGEATKYIQTVIEKINYDTEFVIDINERNPFGPEYSQARYHYNAKFIK